MPNGRKKSSVVSSAAMRNAPHQVRKKPNAVLKENTYQQMPV